MPRLHDTDESLTNEFGATLEDVKQASPALRDLLSESSPDDYNTGEEADKAAVAKLRYWRFTDEDICKSLAKYPARQRDSTSIRELVRGTTLRGIDPIPASLGTALIESAKRNNGRPEVGVATLQEIQSVFDILGGQSTARTIAESGFPQGNDTNIDSVKRRVERGLRVLERAGYVSHKEVGQLYVWYDEGLSSLSLPSRLHNEQQKL
jgi:hypothetical protein